jgi:acyl carrier protein
METDDDKHTKGDGKMDRSQVQSKMRDLLVEELGLDASKINDEALFEEDLEVDSLGVVELLMALEDEFGVRIPDEEAETITSVGQAVDLVLAKLG